MRIGQELIQTNEALDGLGSGKQFAQQGGFHH
jgi:hypothetical protein